MGEHKYVVLLNQCLKRYLIGLGRKDKDRVREKFEFLEAGIWDSGVRVKKLKGLSGKMIFEARLSRGERLIFTLGKHRSQTAIYVWGLAKHDDITKTAKNVFPENAPFLHFEPEIVEDRAEILLDELPGEYYSQEALEEKSPDDYGPQKWLVLSDEEWKRMLLAADPDNFEIFLFLTPEQRRVLESDPPLLLSGTAGSGKTTLSVYSLLKKEFLGKKRLFLTYNRYLKEFSQKIYWGLVSRTEIENSGPAPDFFVFGDLLHALARSSGLNYESGREVGLREFEGIFRKHRLQQKYDGELVWEEIRSIIKGAKPQIGVERFRKLAQAFNQGPIGQDDLKELKEYLLGLKCHEFMDKIERSVQRMTGHPKIEDFVRNLDPGEGRQKKEQKSVLAEIVRFMEKKAKSFSSPMLTYQEYVNIGRKRAPNFLYDRHDIYDIAEFYQRKLEEESLWDEIDLCREAIRQTNRRENTRFSYDLVVCDEVQDFADIQLSLIFSLAKSHRGIVLTGDPKQIINPSGFRWEEVKNKFYERDVEIPDVYHLNLNFRCVGNIVRLSNALLDLKQQLVGLTGSEMREEWKFSGRPPFLITETDEKEMLKRLALKGAGKIILVRDEPEREKLKGTLGTELIFTIGEAKGLEFDTVFLWKFSIDRKASPIWRRIKNGGSFERSHHPHIKHEINLLYVAITRARNTLIIYDSADGIWDHPLLKDLLYKTGEKDVLSEIWQSVSTPEEWEKQGDYFFEREYYPAAAECYKNADHLQKSEIATAFALEIKSHFKRAGQLFEKNDYHRKAAECFERSGLYDKALPLWEKLKDRDRLTHCSIKLYEQKGEYDKAAKWWFKLGNKGRALENWVKANNQGKIGEYYSSKREYEKAAEAFEKARDYARAASCLQKAKRFDRAADLFYRAEAYEKAIPLYKKGKNRDKLLSCYLKINDGYNAGLLYEKEKDVEKAVRLFSDFAGISPENRNTLLEEAKTHLEGRSKLKSAIRFSALAMHEDAAPIFFEKGHYQMAITGYRNAGDLEKSAECYVALRDYYHAALEYEASDAPGKWSKARDLLHLFLASGDQDSFRKAGKLRKEAGTYFEAGSFDRALVRYKTIIDDEGVYRSYLNLDRDEEAIRHFLSDRKDDYANRYLEEKKRIVVSPDFLEEEVSKLSSNRVSYPESQGYAEVMTRLFSMALDEDAGQKTSDLIDRFLSSIHYAFFYHSSLPKSLLDLMLRVKHYNAIIELLKYQQLRKRPAPKQMKSFVSSLKETAEKESDDGLLACYHFLKNRSLYEKTLENLSITKRNYKLFGESAKHYQKAVRFLLEEKQKKEAIGVCNWHRDYLLSAKIYEDSGEVVLAARDYRDGRFYEDAIRCYREVHDEQGIARVYERMGRYDKALAIWRRLGRTKEINRILKKKTKRTKQAVQMELF